ncbi:MAG: hypothetical protein ACKVQV_06830 [Bacteroidia bacterium]
MRSVILLSPSNANNSSTRLSAKIDDYFIRIICNIKLVINVVTHLKKEGLKPILMALHDAVKGDNPSIQTMAITEKVLFSRL